MTTTSYVFTKNILALAAKLENLTADTLKVMLLTSYQPSIDSHEFVSDILAAGSETSGTGYTAGGQTLTTVTFTQSGHGFILDCDNPQWNASGGTLAASIAVFYDSAPGSNATNPALCYWDLGGMQTASGLFTLTIPTTGLLNFTAGPVATGGGTTTGSGGTTTATAGIVPLQQVDSSDSGTGDGYPVFIGAWSTASNPGDLNGTDMYIDAAGSMSVSFTTGHTAQSVGGSFKIYGSQVPYHGIAAVSVDGGAETMVDCYAAARVDGVLLYASPNLTDGAHTLKWRWTGTKNALSGGTVVNMDHVDLVNVIPRVAGVITGGGGGTGFVTRNGTLLVNGTDTSWQFVGLNSFCLFPGCGVNSQPFGTVQARRNFFATMRTDGKMVFRIWGFPNYSGNLSDIDSVLADAATYNFKVIIGLSDAQGGCGDSSGASNHAAFCGGGWRGTYLSWIKTICARYKDNTNLLGWDLCNELDGNTSNILSFYQGASAAIRAVDPNHLLFSGTQPPWNFPSSAAWAAVQATCDVACMHEYDNTQAPSGHFSIALSALSSNGVSRPLLVEEFGIDSGILSGSSRASEIESKLGYYAGSNSAACGGLYWSLMNGSPGGFELIPGDPGLTAIKNHVIPA